MRLNRLVRGVEERVLEVDQVAGDEAGKDLPPAVGDDLRPTGETGEQETAILHPITFSNDILTGSDTAQRVGSDALRSPRALPAEITGRLGPPPIG